MTAKDEHAISKTSQSSRVPFDLFSPMEELYLVAEQTVVSIRGKGNGFISRVVASSIEHVLRSFDQPLTVADLAGRVGLSRFHFTRRFRRETGITPGAFLKRYRMVRAMEMLSKSNDPINAIASRVGYGNHAAFSRAFAKIAGIPPTMYRLAH